MICIKRFYASIYYKWYMTATVSVQKNMDSCSLDKSIGFLECRKKASLVASNMSGRVATPLNNIHAALSAACLSAKWLHFGCSVWALKWGETFGQQLVLFACLKHWKTKSNLVVVANLEGKKQRNITPKLGAFFEEKTIKSKKTPVWEG